MSVFVVIDKRAARVPTRLRTRLHQARFLRHIRKRSIPVVAVQSVLPVVSHKQIVVAVVVVIADAARLPPPRPMLQSRSFRHVGERAVAIVLKQMAARFLPCRKAFQTPAIHQENVQPAVVVVIVKGQAASGGFEQILVLMLAAIDGLYVNPDSFTTSTKLNPSGVPSMGDFGPFGGAFGFAS